MTDEQEIREAIGKRLRALRLLNGKTQQEIASTMGLSAQQWQKYEKGINTISSARLYLLAIETGRPITDFYDELDSELLQAQGHMEDFRIIATVRALNRIESESLRNHLYRLIVTLAEQTSTEV